MIEGGIKINLDKEDKPLNAVQLSTYHSSKGREFEYVFMPFLTSKKWESSSSSYKDKIPMATEFTTFEECEEKQAQSKFLDNIKLLYVGMTRAKHSLYLTCVDTGTKDFKPSWFIKQLKDKFQDEPDYLAYPEKPEIQGLEKPTADYDYKKEFEEFIRSRFQKSYSASSLNTYRKCPREYFYNYILGLKSSSGNRDNLTYGLAVHKAFQYTINYALENKKYPTVDEAYEVFAKSVDELPCSNPEKMKQSGKIYIFSNGTYYDEFISICPPESLESRAELELKYTTENGVSFNGSIDRIDKNKDGTYSIYDYKTGTDNSGITKSGAHSDYYYQIGFYKYLFKKQFGIDADVTTTFIYPLLAEDFHTEKDIPDDVSEEIASEFIDIVGKIQNLEFDRPHKCPNEKFCSYKNLCKMNAI
jgi:ATP-dependent exoDNAse (exonuclease V) beta subunit